MFGLGAMLGCVGCWLVSCVMVVGTVGVADLWVI